MKQTHKEKQKLRDQYGRVMRKLRVSLLDACNLRCFYCMPENTHFQKLNQGLPQEKLFSLIAALVNQGIQQIRLTGGEPLLYPDLHTMVEQIAELNVNKFGLTTNGLLLGEHLPLLKQNHCLHVNVSLDSLRSSKATEIAKRNVNVDQILLNVYQALELDFPIKINVVLMRGVNDDELVDFVQFSLRHDIEVRFLELMKIGRGVPLYQRHFMPAAEALKTLSQHFDIERISADLDSTSMNYLVNGKAKVGFIASESQPFCGGCSRLRLSSKGFLRACLMSEEGIDISQASTEQLPILLNQVLEKKPIHRIEKINEHMHKIGG